MNSVTLPQHKLKRFVVHLCLAAKKYDQQRQHLSSQEMIVEVEKMKKDLAELSRKEASLYGNSRKSEFIIADLRKRVTKLEQRITDSLLRTQDEVQHDHDRIIFLTQSMDSLRDRLSQLRYHSQQEVKKVTHEDKEIVELKRKIAQLEQRFHHAKKSGDKDTIKRLSERIAHMKQRVQLS